MTAFDAERPAVSRRFALPGMIRPRRWRAIVRPAMMGIVAALVWELAVRHFHVPVYVVPGPVDIAKSLISDWDLLSASLLVTIRLSFLALLLALASAILVAVIFTEFRLVEDLFAPYAVILQVTPTVAIAPLIIIWVNSALVALLICATIIVFFPILANTITGLKSVDRNLLDLFRIYRASRWQTLIFLKLPAALPYFLSSLRISGGLSLVGAVVAEFVAGTAGQGSGLAYRILEAGYQLQFPRMFAALALISLTGVAMYFLTSGVSHLCLRRWHESSTGGDQE